MKQLESIFLGFLFLISGELLAQNFYVYPSQALEFGVFTIAGKGGTVTISDTGERSSSGTVQLLNSNFHPAIFQITTDSTAPIEVFLEISVEVLTNAEGTATLRTSVSPVEKTYILQEGKPVQVKVGATIQLNSGANSSGEFQGNISINVFPNSE